MKITSYFTSKFNPNHFILPAAIAVRLSTRIVKDPDQPLSP
jgi:hypothetical protein